MESLQDRLDNLMMFLQEIANGDYGNHNLDELKSQANYHIATMDLLNNQGT